MGSHQGVEAGIGTDRGYVGWLGGPIQLLCTEIAGAGGKRSGEWGAQGIA